MATTVRLLSTYNGYKPQSIITVEDSIATQLIQNKNATLDLTGGTPSFDPLPGSGISTGTSLPPNQTVTAGQTVTIVVPAGATLGVTASADIVGTRETLNPDGSVANTATLFTGLSTVGVFLVDTKVRFNVSFGSVTTKAGVTAGSVDSTPLYVSDATLIAGEDQDRGWQTFVNGASFRKPIPSSSVDLLLGISGKVGDYLERIDFTVLAAGSSQLVLREGQTAPVLSIATHASTASTTTVINTAVNPVAVTANQFRDCLMKVGMEYRHVLAHSAFAAGVVNTYTLDRALGSAPAAGVTVAIENRNFVYEFIPFGMPAGAYSRDIKQTATQAGWRASSGDGVRGQATGSFT